MKLTGFCEFFLSWLVLSYPEDTKSAVLYLAGSGSGGIEEARSYLKDDGLHYVYFRETVGDNESKRAKFVFLSWAGEQVSAIKRAKMSVHKADVKKVISSFAIEMHCSQQSEISQGEIKTTLNKVGGANYSCNT